MDDLDALMASRSRIVSLLAANGVDCDIDLLQTVFTTLEEMRPNDRLFIVVPNHNPIIIKTGEQA